MADDFDFSSVSDLFDRDDAPKEQGGSTRAVHSGTKRTKVDVTLGERPAGTR